MASVKLSDEALLAFFQSHPGFRDRLASIVGAVGNVDGDLGEADAAEERLVEEMRLLSREALQGWADERVEATERHIDEGLSPKEAAIKAMDEVAGPVVALALILIAVFVPTVFISGITGRLYQQFAINCPQIAINCGYVSPQH